MYSGITQMPSAAYPLLNGNTAKSSSDQKGCSAQNRKAIIIIVSMAAVLVIAGAVAAVFLIPASASSSSISQTRSKLNTSYSVSFLNILYSSAYYENNFVVTKLLKFEKKKNFQLSVLKWCYWVSGWA